MLKLNWLRQSRKLIVTFVTAIAILAPMQAMAQVRGYLSNFDVWNFSGRTANDFELYLGGIRPGMITSLWKVAFPNATITDLGTGVLIHWTGGVVPDTGHAHFGVHVVGNAMPRPVTYSWTWNGAVIFSIPPAWQGWNFTGPVYQDVIQNWSSNPIYVQRRWAVTSAQIDLPDLMRDGQLWNSGTIIDPQPVPVPPNGTLTFDFPMSTDPDAWYVLMYDEFDSRGRLIRTFLNAAQAAPAGKAHKSK